MNNRIFTTRFLFVLTMILAAAVMRLVPHWPNFTPVAALALFSGTYVNRKYLAFLIPLFALFLGDIVLGLHEYMVPVYASFILTVLIGFAIKKKTNVFTIVLSSVASSLLFFLITNFASWIQSPLIYDQTFNGLMTCYIAGLPFFLNGILGDLFYNGVLFGGLFFAISKIPALQKA
jgi:hypothetical protein